MRQDSRHPLRGGFARGGFGRAHWLAVTLVASGLLSCDDNRYPTRDASADTKRETGPVNITGKLNPCPEVVIVASPSRTTVGSSVDLSGHASDPDEDTLTYRWKADNGSFSHQTSAGTAYTCPAPGTFVITLTVNDGDCDAVESTTVLCMPGDGGVPDGGADGGGGDAKVDAPVDVGPGTGGGAGTGTGGSGGGTSTGSGGTSTGSGGASTGTGGAVVGGGGRGGAVGSGGTTTSSGGISGGSGGAASGTGGAATGSGGASTGTGGASTGTGGATTGGDACDQCARDSCEPTDGCTTLTDAADRQLCQAAYDCVVQKRCSEGSDPFPCYCGGSGASCTSDGAADGVCLAPIAAAAKTEPGKGSLVYARFQSASFPLGRAMNLVVCQLDFCATECGPRFGR